MQYNRGELLNYYISSLKSTDETYKRQIGHQIVCHSKAYYYNIRVFVGETEHGCVAQ